MLDVVQSTVSDVSATRIKYIIIIYALSSRICQMFNLFKHMVLMKNFNNCVQVKGLLEVEPLHFSCSAASDGTKLEVLEQNHTGMSGAVAASPLISSLLDGPTSNAIQVSLV